MFFDATPQRRRDLIVGAYATMGSRSVTSTPWSSPSFPRKPGRQRRVCSHPVLPGSLVAERAGVLVAITHAVSPLDVAETVRNHLREQLPGYESSSQWHRRRPNRPMSSRSGSKPPSAPADFAEALGHDDRVALTDAYQPYSIFCSSTIPTPCIRSSTLRSAR